MQRHPIWFERAVLPELRDEVMARAEMLGPGTEQRPLHQIERARGAVVGVHPLDADAMGRAPELLVIARTGIGLDSIDVAAATARGIAVCNTPDAPTVSTAEHAVALLLAVSKRLGQAHRRLQDGRDDLYTAHRAIELDGAVLGLVGYGRIARRVAAAARGLGMRVAIFDPYLSEEPAQVEVRSSLVDLLATSDVVSVHIPLTDDTAGTFGAAQFAALREGAVFVNTARGGLVDQNALLDALDTGHLFGAGLDVTDPEPLPPDHPLLHRDDVVVTPHVATATDAGRQRLQQVAFEQAIQVLDGHRPPHLVNPEVWPRVQRRRSAQ